jgi:nanoRNase/pAp phosphatase (c-di-AMP/oligoRNAs hydrolase)
VIPVVNTSQLPSEIGNRLCEDYPGADYALMWYERRDGEVQLSFRSVGPFDVGRLAASIGGGGHKNAAGARISWATFDQRLREPAWWEVNEVQSSHKPVHV